MPSNASRESFTPGFFERREVLAEKQRLYPEGAWFYERDGEGCGYFLTHPWKAGSIPPLDTMLGAVPSGGTYYLHDLALLPEARGMGAAGTIVSTVLTHAAASGFRTATLVAVNNAQPFWTRHGFGIVDAPELTGKLSAYEPAARLMQRALG